MIIMFRFGSVKEFVPVILCNVDLSNEYVLYQSSSVMSSVSV